MSFAVGLCKYVANFSCKCLFVLSHVYFIIRIFVAYWKNNTLTDFFSAKLFLGVFSQEDFYLVVISPQK